MLIEARDLQKIYKMEDVEVPALKRVSFSVKAGEFISIMGPSGSGKSTLMHLIGCLDRPTSGVIKIEDQETTNLSDNELAVLRNKKIGFVFQFFNLLPRATALANVELPMIYAGVSLKERTKRAKEALDAVGLADRFYHRPTQLSGGQQQRVATARALVNNPSIILADEPTGNLDTKSGAEVMAILQKLHIEEKRTIILVTHELYVAEHAQRIIQLLDGKIVADRAVSNRKKAREILAEVAEKEENNEHF
ncbi:MAG: ABC transporter ATP-binding protein [Candidatus Subteraquimicrobiales bacterium]|nr:ABC transporter ATP-binding protein [Candidatus Subteraquimicrobiales bacterium]